MTIGRLLFICLLAWPKVCSILFAQPVISFDYRLAQVRMIQVDSLTGQRQVLEDLGALLYDIGPTPAVIFEVEIEQLANPTPLAQLVTLAIERYVLLESRKQAHLAPSEPQSFNDAVFEHPTWVYSGPIDLKVTRESHDKRTVLLTTSPFTIDVLDPDQPLTYAHPEQYKLLGFAYRFYLKPASFRAQDLVPENNVEQIILLKK